MLASGPDGEWCADVVKNVFGNDGQVGSLQIRSASADKLQISTNIFNVSNLAGTYGTAIPTFRSDRAVAPGDRLVLTGTRQDSGAHTNFFLQETAGVGVTVQTEFLSASGGTLGTRSDTVGPFGLSQINNAAPSGAVAAILWQPANDVALYLPNMDGLAVLARLRGHDQTRSLPVVILSNYSEAELVQRGLRLGALEYLIKSQTTPAQVAGNVPNWLNS